MAPKLATLPDSADTLGVIGKTHLYTQSAAKSPPYGEPRMRCLHMDDDDADAHREARSTVRIEKWSVPWQAC